MVKKISRQKDFNGFTLFEVLVVLGILALISLVGTAIFAGVLRNATKTKTVVEVKQNGDYALGVMERQIRNAQTVEGEETEIYPFYSKIKVTPFEGEAIFFECDEEQATIKINNQPLISETVRVFSDCETFFKMVEEGEAGVRPARWLIEFTLCQKQDSPRPEDLAKVSFQTEVTLRNY